MSKLPKLSGNIAIDKLIHVKRTMKGKDGQPVEVLVIPIKENGLYVGEKSIGFNIDLVPNKDSADKYDNLGFIAKQTPIKNVFGEGKKWADLTQTEKDKIGELSPILGNFKEAWRSNNQSTGEVEDTGEDLDDYLPF